MKLLVVFSFPSPFLYPPPQPPPNSRMHLIGRKHACLRFNDKTESQELMDNPPSAAFVATMGHQVVGVFVANREACGGDEVARLRSLFELEDFIAFDRHRPRNQAVMTALALNPIFAGHCRFALKEVRVGGLLRVHVNAHRGSYSWCLSVYSISWTVRYACAKHGTGYGRHETFGCGYGYECVTLWWAWHNFHT